MDVVEALQQEAREGRVSAERLIETQQRLLQAMQQQLQATQQQLQVMQQQLDAARRRIDELERKLGTPPTAKLAEAYSMRGEEQRQQARAKKRKVKRKGRRGRLRTKDKIALAERSEPVYPEGVPPQECRLSHVRPVWRLEQRRAVLIAYQVYRGPNGRYGQIPGVLGRSEYGLEIVTEIAHLVYIVGLSFDKVCALLHFFQNLPLKKSQLNALLYRLSRQWERQFEVLCTLLANSLVVHADETSWSVNSVWALLAEKARVLLFGVHKDAGTLHILLDPQTFAGIVISDDYAVYGRFSAAQKCWAHLLRKAIKHTLQDPSNKDYRRVADCLLEIYRQACRLQRDQRYSQAGRAAKVAILDDAIFDLCGSVHFAKPTTPNTLEHEHRLLLAEIFRLMMAQQLFTFVTAVPVEQPNGNTVPVPGTNNEAERSLRNTAQARKMGRTNKTIAGARRQSILTSVVESLRVYLASYTLDSVVAELTRWATTGSSCFERQLHELHVTWKASTTTILDRIFPNASPSPIPTG